MAKFSKFPNETSLKRNYNLALYWVQFRDNIIKHANQTIDLKNIIAYTSEIRS